MTKVTYISPIAVETDSLLIASKVAGKVSQLDKVRGEIMIDGKKYRWSTIQQYEYHNGFTRK